MDRVKLSDLQHAAKEIAKYKLLNRLIDLNLFDCRG